MAKKKVTKKKTRAASARKSAAARKPVKKKVAKKSAKKPATRKTTKKKTTKKRTTKKVAKKTAKKPATKKKTAKKAPAAASKKKTTKKTAATAKGSTKKKSRSRSAAPARPAPDANGYVIINGRRVRMMSVATEGVTVAKKVRTRTKAAAAPEIEEKARKPVKTKLSKKDLDHYRSLLLAKRTELVGDLSAMENQALQSGGGHLSHMPIHMADVGTDTFDQDFMLGMAENERQRLREIDAALKRIEDKTYGICQMTDKVIPKTRLNAKPWARYTIEAAREMERGLGE